MVNYTNKHKTTATEKGSFRIMADCYFPCTNELAGHSVIEPGPRATDM